MTPVTQAPGEGRSRTTGELPVEAALQFTPETGAHVAQTIDAGGDSGRTIVLTVDTVAPGASAGGDSSILDGGLDTRWVVPERGSRRFARSERPVASETHGDVMRSSDVRVPEARPRMVELDLRPRALRGDAPPPVPADARDEAPGPRRRTARRPAPFVPPARAARAARAAQAAADEPPAADGPRVAAEPRRRQVSDREPAAEPRRRQVSDREPAAEPRRRATTDREPTAPAPRRRRDTPVADWGVAETWTPVESAATTIEIPLRIEDRHAEERPVVDWLADEGPVTPPVQPEPREAAPSGPRTRPRSTPSSTRPGLERRMSGPIGGVAGRRTVQIGGLATVPGVPRLVEIERRRPARHPMERLSDRPDRIAMWAFLLGLFLILVAALSANAGV